MPFENDGAKYDDVLGSRHSLLTLWRRYLQSLPSRHLTTIKNLLLAAAANSLITWNKADVDKFGWVIVMYQNNIGEDGPESAPLMMP